MSAGRDFTRKFMNGKTISKVYPVDLKKEYQEISPEIKKAIFRVLESGWFILGEELKSFEKEFSEYLGVKYAVGVNSGTDALYLALLAAGVGPGDEVITVSNTFISDAYTIYQTGAKPVLIEVDEKTYNIDTKLIEKTLTKKTKAILPIHLYGYPAKMDEIMRIAQKHNLLVIEDACQAHGSVFKGRKLGTIGDIGCFSFYPAKNLGAYGDAGAVVTDNEDLANKLFMLRNYGEKQKYYYQLKGISSRLDEIQAAVLRVKLKHLDGWNKKRRLLADRYRWNLASLPIILPPEDSKDCQGNYYVFVVRVKDRDTLQQFLKDNGVVTLIHYPVAIHQQESCPELIKTAGLLQLTERISKEILSLPIYPQMQMTEVDYVCDKIKEFYRK